jgi:hypothetical protein
MSGDFASLIPEIEAYAKRLEDAELFPYDHKDFPDEPGIYLFYEKENAVRVGRAKKLKTRIKGHSSKNYKTAAFAFKLTRKATNKPTTYTPEGSREDLMKDPEFRAEFDKNIERIKKMKVKYIVVESSIHQYLLELYISLAHDLDLSEFDTH